MNGSEEKLSASFNWLNITQFLGALNDNIFRLLLIFFLIGTYGTDKASNASALAGAVFVIPFLLFTAFAGKLADRFSKRNIVISVKAAEVVVICAGFVAFILGSPIIVCAVLFLMCTQSAFFGPSKYGIVPELVKSEQLSKANSFLEAFTYIAIVIGTAVAPFVAEAAGEQFYLASILCVVVAVAGLFCSFSIQWTEPAGGGKKASVFFIKDIAASLYSIRKDKDLVLAVIASAYFMLLGGFMQMNLIPYGIQSLGFSEIRSGYLFLIAALGIGAGAYLAGKLSGRNVEVGIVPLGAVGLALCSIGLAVMEGNRSAVFTLIFLTGVSAGMFIVPVHALIQLRSPNKTRGQVIAASGFLGWVGVLLSAVILYVFAEYFKMTAAQMFFILGLLTLILAVVSIIMLPDFLVRLIIILVIRLCYRVKVKGLENMPTAGGVLLVSNHVSWVDAFILGSTQQRRIRFIIDRDIYNYFWVKPVCKLMRAIPISAKEPPKKIVASLRQARSAIKEGYIVCIFAEGAITRTGMLGEFKGGFERIMKKSPYTVIPAYIGGAWGSIFSYSSGKLLSSLPRKFPYPVSIHFGQAMPAGSSSLQIRQKVLELSCEYYNDLKSPYRSLAYQFIKSARKYRHRRCICDATGKHLSYGKTLITTLAIGEELDKLTGTEDKIGILLPPSVAGVLVNLAATVQGKVSVNLSYVTSEQGRRTAIEESGVKCVVSSRKFLEKTEIKDKLPGPVFIEDIIDRIKTGGKLKAYLRARFMPLSILARGCQRRNDDVATIIFSSGSTGTPKGVMLSHHNLLSNIEALRMVVRLRPNDDLCAVLPFFHSFGFNCGLWLPLTSGVSVNYIANPLDGKTVAKSIRKNRSTILFAAPTFLLTYMRRSEPDDLVSLRLIASGAEKLKESIADSFEGKFGIRPLEGYGATELSPVISLNVPDAQVRGIRQVGNKPGSAGHPVPGIAAKVVDPETNEPLEVGQEGLLMVKGPNVMIGYLNMPAKSREVITDGWYDTGDIARIDEDGFITITDRLARFSKIGGEMVPHLGIEEVYIKALGIEEQVVAVIGVPDAKKGEELVVLYLDEAGNAKELKKIIEQSDVPNMWKPRKNNYIRIDSMPLLGSGKLDIMKLRKIAIAAKNDSSKWRGLFKRNT